VTFNNSTITTLPRRQAVVYAPAGISQTGDAAVGAALWSTLRCSFCHGDQAQGAPNAETPLRGTTLTFDEFYHEVRTGKDKMPAFGWEELPDRYLLDIWTWLTEASAQ
jgi:mono/diheme cytochrome c family protein